MGNSDYLPNGEAQFKLWFDNFMTQVEKNDAVLGINSEQYNALNALHTTYNTKIAASTAAKELYAGTVDAKNVARKNGTAAIRSYAKQWKSNPAIPAEVLGELGIVSSSTSGPVTKVTGLDVVGCDDGDNKLTWNRNGNANGTTFIIEYRINGTTNWSFAGAVSKTSFTHDDQIPGQMVWYRVFSVRAGENSGPCPPVAAYGIGGNASLSVAA